MIPYLGPRLFTKDQNGRRLLNKCVTWALLSYQTTSGICINVCLNALHNRQESIMFKFRGSWWQSCYCIGAFATRISEKSSNTTTTTILIVRISCLFSLIGWESSSPQKLVPRLLSGVGSSLRSYVDFRYHFTWSNRNAGLRRQNMLLHDVFAGSFTFRYATIDEHRSYQLPFLPFK